MAERLEVVIDSKANLTAFNSLIGKLPSLRTLAVGAGAAIAGMGAGILAITKSTATAYDKVQKFADRIGISTEALSAYHHVADLSGVSIEAMNMGFQRMTRRISEAEAGTGVAGKALEELGISIESIAGQSPDKQFEIIAGALDGVAFQGDKARLAMQFFDSEGVALLQTLTNGTAGLEAMKAEAEKFGLVVSAKAGANAAAFNDSLTRLTGSFKGLKNYMAEQVMPTITALANRMADWIANNRQQIIDYAKSFIGSMAKVVEYGAYAIAGLIDAWRGLKMVFEVLKIGFSTFVKAMVEGLSFLTGKMLSFMEAVNVGGVFDGAIANIKSFQKINEDVIFALEQTGQTAYANLNKIVDEGLAIDKVAEFTEQAKELLAELSTEGDAEPKAIQPFTKENIKKTEENAKEHAEKVKAAYESLNEMWYEQNTTERERLFDWYEEQQELFIGNEEALFKAKEVYLKKRQKLIDSENKKEFDRQKQLDRDKKQWADSQFSSALDAIKSFGEKGKRIWKIAKTAEAIISTASGAARALSEYTYPYSLAVMAAVLVSGFAQVARINSAHTGLTRVPAEEPYLLDRGERVVSRVQNEDLTRFLNNEGAVSGNGQQIFQMEMHILENATSAEALLEMSQEDWEEIIEDRVIPGLNALSQIGIKPTY